MIFQIKAKEVYGVEDCRENLQERTVWLVEKAGVLHKFYDRSCKRERYVTKGKPRRSRYSPVHPQRYNATAFAFRLV